MFKMTLVFLKTAGFSCSKYLFYLENFFFDFRLVKTLLLCLVASILACDLYTRNTYVTLRGLRMRVNVNEIHIHT